MLKKDYSIKNNEWKVKQHESEEKMDKIEQLKKDLSYEDNNISSTEEVKNSKENIIYVNENKYNKHTGVSSSKKYFSVFRVGKKIKSINQFKAIEKHMEREIEVENANPELSKYNRILIGDRNIYENAINHIEGIKIRKNANLGVDLVLSTGNGFFENMFDCKKEQWIKQNIKFLKNNFGDNCIYASLHVDETTPHIHAIIVPKFWDDEKKCYKLQSNRYFDGIDKMKNWQDKYSDYMNEKFSNLIRGIRGSKAKHMDIKTYYSLINKSFNIQDDNQILAYAQRNFLIEKRLKSLEYTLARMNENGDTKKLLGKIEKLEKNNGIYKETIKEITKKYGIKEKEILELVDKVQSKGRERTK